MAVVWTTSDRQSRLPLPIFLLGDLQVLTKKTMKRKRGPAPHGKKVRIKPKETNEPDPVEDSDEEGNDFDDEEDSFKGISDDEQNHRPVVSEEPVNNVNGTTKKDKSRGGKKIAPTKEELMDLLFQSSSFQSNLFKLQIDQLLAEVRIKHEKMEKVERILHKLKDILATLPESPEQLVLPLPRSELTKVVYF